MKTSPGRASALRDPAFRALLASDGLMLLSLMLGQVALPWWIGQQGGATDLAAYGMVVAVTLLAGMPLLGPLGDRRPKRLLSGIGLGPLSQVMESESSLALLVSDGYKL